MKRSRYTRTAMWDDSAEKDVKRVKLDSLVYNTDVRTNDQSFNQGGLMEAYMIPDVITFLSLAAFVWWL